ncbi:hypothetical protein SEA_UPYO_64 [Gordonia phage Upyo]|nr:hypothetical protein SEA_UPYO_64 [Gordonia phage Upyo]
MTTNPFRPTGVVPSSPIPQFGPPPDPVVPNPIRANVLGPDALTGQPASGTSTASGSAAGSMDTPSLVEEARALKARMDADKERYDEIRSTLWDRVGQKAGEVPGTTAKFQAPSSKPSRRVDYKRLERHPEVYAEVVVETPPNPDAPGRLYL